MPAETIWVERPRWSSQAIRVPSGDQDGFSFAPGPLEIWTVRPVVRSRMQIWKSPSFRQA